MRGTEIDREFHRQITSTSAQSEIFIPSHSHITNSSIYCRCKLTWSPMYCTNRIRPTEILMAGQNRQDQHWQLITERERAVRHDSSKSHDFSKQDFLRTTADAGKKIINKMTTKQGQDKSQLY